MPVFVGVKLFGDATEILLKLLRRAHAHAFCKHILRCLDKLKRKEHLLEGKRMFLSVARLRIANRLHELLTLNASALINPLLLGLLMNQHSLLSVVLLLILVPALSLRALLLELCLVEGLKESLLLLLNEFSLSFNFLSS